MNIDQAIAQAQERLLRAPDAEIEAARNELADLLETKRLESGDIVVSLDAGESSAVRRLRAQTAVGRYLVAAMNGQRVEGAEEELRQEVGAKEGEIPYAAFDNPARQFRNADAATGAPSTIGINMDRIVPAAFAESIAEFLGVAMPMVPSGQYSVPRLTTNLTAGSQAKGGKQESTAAAFTVVNAKPKRLSARLSLQAEDLAEVGIPAFEAALQTNLRMVLADALDIQILRGTGSSGQIQGLVPQLTADTDPAGAINFAGHASDLAGYLDGKFAGGLSDLRVIHNAAVYAKLAATFATNDDSVSALEWASRQGIEQRCNANMSASSSNIGKSIVVRSGTMAMGVEGAPAVCPVWGNLTIRDPYTDSGAATEHLTIHALIGKVLVRYPDAYAQYRVKTA